MARPDTVKTILICLIHIFAWSSGSNQDYKDGWVLMVFEIYGRCLCIIGDNLLYSRLVQI